jgi:hypothetical protein
MLERGMKHTSPRLLGSGADARVGALGGFAQVRLGAGRVAARQQELTEFQMGLEVVGGALDRAIQILFGFH